MEQTLILVDEFDNFLGYAPKSECHLGEGRLHRAIAVLLFNSRREILLQKRKSKLWDGFWDITGATHVLHHSSVSHNESYEEAARRCLGSEWNIAVSSLDRIFGFTYFERFDWFCENEYCTILMGLCDGPAVLNPDYAYDKRWVSFQEVTPEVRHNPSIYTPWARIAIDKIALHPNSSSLTTG